MQDRYRVYIDERVSWSLTHRGGAYLYGQIDKHYTTFKTARHTAPASTQQDELESLSSIVLLFRTSLMMSGASTLIDRQAKRRRSSFRPY